ncbi:putative Ig domain-containing protein [Kitasatospora sp. NBC_01287]|uniref:putative Ig domain-containing protein n=1 Tax=Kitasatospora sp. NBC_01287 TaxID=2903573 RepID=UPI00225BD3B4|nr:putative Ig domain-containing protein [Kitasatospora sp. NBC_01287]MCX4745897.1 putative Ig domain-containing protein [Kitasatospora sp. NBC_01287]
MHTPTRSSATLRRGLGRASAAAVSVTALIAAGLSLAAAPAGASVPALSAQTPTHQVCATPHAGQMGCLALKRTDISPELATPNATVSGYGPSQLQSAYNLASAAASSGTGQTVAVVDAFDDPNAASDLNAYRSQFGLPACSSGCFTKVNQSGQTSPLPSPAPASDDWTGEEALDVDMVSAICPNCHIILVEASSESNDDLGTAVNAAVNLGAKYVSNSYGGGEASNDSTYDSEYYDHPGVAVTASSGDSGYGVEYPAASQYVTAVGGTALSTASNSRGWTESVWNTSSSEGAGSGCSADDAKPSWQKDTGCAKRTVADVSAVADPATGVAVYDTYNNNGGWNVYGGTSVASPLIAAVYALAGTPAAGSTPASYPYAHTTALNDVTSGSTASCSPAYLCTAEVGYDGPTGLGTPNGTTAFASGTSTGNTVTVTNPGSQSGKAGTAVSLQLSGTDSASGQSLSYTATGLPAGLSISSSGLISGTPTTAGTSSVTVTAKDSTGATGSTTFSWTVSSATGNTVTVTSPGNQSGTVGTAVSLQVSGTDSASGQSLSYSATGLPAGLSISSSGLISGTPTTAGTSSVTVTATDSTGATGSATFSWTVAAGTGCTGGGQLLGNAGFETGTASPWTASAGVIDNSSSEPAHSGSWKAWLDGYGTTHTDTLSQTVTIPAGCKATFSFWLHIDTAETGTTAYDKLAVTANGTNLATYSNVNKNTGYVQKSFDLSSYAGKSVTLKFTGTEDSSLQTSFVIDDTALNAS